MGRGKNLGSRPDIVLALGKVESDKVEHRLNGLIELRRIINDNRRGSKLRQVDDRGYHAILETVFRIAKVDVIGLARATQYTTTKIAARLSACAGLVRTIVEVGLVKLRYKTVKAIVEHVSQTLPTADAGYCEPLQVDYFKALNTLLEYKPHTEHLSPDDWHEVSQFCVETARDLNRRTDQVHSFSSHDSQQLAYPQLQVSNEDIVLCLRHLLSATNAPIVLGAGPILNLVLDLLSTYPHPGKIQHSLYEILDSVLSCIVTSDTSLTLRTMERVLPLIKRAWDRATQPQREPMLSILIRGELLFGHLIRSDNRDETRESLSALLEEMKEHYCVKKPKDQLSMEGLDVSHFVPSGSQAGLHLDAAPLRMCTTKGEESWYVIRVSAAIYLALEATAKMKLGLEEKDEYMIPSKRRKITRPMDDLLQYVKGRDTPTRVYALQVLAFSFTRHCLEDVYAPELTDLLISILSNDDNSVVPWAILVIATLAVQEQGSTHLVAFWPRIWRLTCGHVASPTTCDVACTALVVILENQLVSYQDINDSVDNMLASADLNGPVTSSGAAAKLSKAILVLRRRESLTADLNMSNAILRWLFRCWDLTGLRDRTHAEKFALHISVSENMDLVCRCLGNSMSVPAPSAPDCLGRLSRTSLVVARHASLVTYLLQDSTKPSSESNPGLDVAIASNREQPVNALQQTHINAIAEFIDQQCSFLCSCYINESSNTLDGVNGGIIRSSTQIAVFGYGMLSSLGLQPKKYQALLGMLNKLRECVRNAMLCHTKRRDCTNTFLETVGSFIGSLQDIRHKNGPLALGIISIAQGLDKNFWNSALQDPSQRSEHDDDSDVDSQTVQQQNADQDSSVIHDEVLAITHVDAFRACVRTKICYASSLNARDDEAKSPGHTSSILVDYLTSLQRQDFVLCRAVLRDLLDSDMPLSEDDADTLLQYIQQVVVRPYALEKSEVAIGLCMETLASLTYMWTTGLENDIVKTGAELYVWFMNKVLDSGSPSPHVLCCAADLLRQVYKLSPDYAKDLSLASARTTLLQVLREGSILVKYEIGKKIADLFGGYVLKEHVNILEDIIDSLPSDPSFIEGIALRLNILGILGSIWPTLLRRCTYAIFETAGRVLGSVGYARCCLDRMSDELDLSDSRVLFKLFAPQLIYTWLETQPMNLIPFKIFGYADLKELLQDIQDEIVGQVMMRGKTEEHVQLAKDLSQPFQNLLVTSFSKVAAYSIARDIATPLSEDSPAPRAEAQVKKILGREQYTILVARNFPEIIALFFITTDHEDQIQKAFQRHDIYHESDAIYREIVGLSYSERTLPPNQQPSFRAKNLIPEIDHLCGRTPFDIEAMWTPALYVYVFRKIINCTHPALGSLHNCSVLRKIRILICIAGHVALDGYQLTMALQALRPFLTDAQCADDVVGLMQYLLQQGAEQMREAPSFLIGHAVTTLVSLQSFLSSSQDSTTQESHFRATISKAQAYHAWLVSYLKMYNSPRLSSQAAADFHAMAMAAGSLRQSGSARKDTPESELLMAFLNDQISGRNLLPQSSREYLLLFLGKSFEIPTNFRDDVLGNDIQAVRYAPVIWSTCRSKSAGPEYLSWGGRVLGRAYASRAIVEKAMILETNIKLPPVDVAESGKISNSRARLLSLLSDLLTRDDRESVGLAERALRYIVTHSNSTAYAAECENILDPKLYDAMLCLQYDLPEPLFPSTSPARKFGVEEVKPPMHEQEAAEWIRKLSEALAVSATDDPLLAALSTVLRAVDGLAQDAFPFILHLVLLREHGRHERTRGKVSDLCATLFENSAANDAFDPIVRVLLNAVLYLRTQSMPHETVKADRARWLDVDFRQAALAASKCSMYKTALMLLEIEESERAKTEAISRRKSGRTREHTEYANDLLLDIYQHIDEQDAFYGVKQPSSLSSMMSQLDYEHAGFKGLSFQGAFYDCHIRQSEVVTAVDPNGMIQALNNLDLNGLSQPLVNSMPGSGPRPIDAALNSARKLEKWDVFPPSSYTSSACTIYEAFRKINSATDAKYITSVLSSGFESTLNRLNEDKPVTSSLRSNLSALAIMTEAEEVFSAQGVDQLEEVMEKFRARDQSLHFHNYDHIKDIVSCRETSFSCLSKRRPLQDLLRTSLHDARLMECRMLLASSSVSRGHGALQSSLSTAMYLELLGKRCKLDGVDISAASQYESALVLWSQGETTASVRLLKDLSHSLSTDELDPQAIPVGRPGMLARLGHQTAEARLDKPDAIIRDILKQAVTGLHNRTVGEEAGEVFHEFAAFCDQQLQNADSLADFKRIRKLREDKEDEVKGLDKLIKSASAQPKDREIWKSWRSKAQQWFELDDKEFRRLEHIRLTLLKHSLENYLLCLKASDRFDNDALRFSALWLENNDNRTANEAVAKHIAEVPSLKFAALINQWTSRLVDKPGQFEILLSATIERICIDHPYHGMYQIFAVSKSKGGKDETALARHTASNKIVERFKVNPLAQTYWLAIHNTSVTFVRFAGDKPKDSSIKPGSKVALRKSATGQRMEQDVLRTKVPPPTMTVKLRADCDYSNVPTIAKFQPEYTVAGGVSMPKILTALGTDGKKYKQLFKGGHDDLRQDAIMEQVFQAVSSLLKTQRATRQRDLKIRTYKVLPLTATAGVIEFVPNTIPLHEYLLPAHERHYPRDVKRGIARKHVQDVQSSSTETRIKTFRKVCEQYHPVLRYFFQERFESPDEWFEKRLAYTRSTAASSILGHVLGLGDRHGHNILLDEKTGEVVHIDLGIAFEQGRILPVPEVVPFRLTRDIVDGMGITGTEGVFRRCCEFTLEALRNESYSIMSILDVLRYDPLYSWTLSPLRLKKMQDAQTENPTIPADGGGEGKKEEDGGEAERSLLVVTKKLSRTLSVQATVNELIQQATDERNLALLFAGWAAWV